MCNHCSLYGDFDVNGGSMGLKNPKEKDLLTQHEYQYNMALLMDLHQKETEEM